MGLQITRWSPDTCGCIIDIEWDDSVPAESRVHTFKQIYTNEVSVESDGVKRRLVMGKGCPFHENLPPAQAMAAVHHENRRKNRVIALAMEENPGLEPQDVAWEFDNKRKLKVKLPPGRTISHPKLTAEFTSDEVKVA